MSNMPTLRFKEFSGVWVEKPLGKYGKLINGLTYSPDNIVEDGLLVLRSSNIQNEHISFEDNVYVNLDVDKDYLTQENDILICVRNGSKRLIGKSLLIKNGLPKATHGAFMTVFRGASNKFISHWLKTPMFFKEVHKNLGATINSINGSNLKKFKTFFPKEQEQEKIASFLTSVDTKIEQLVRKEELLRLYKKGVMQRIFNQEIRFKADNGSEFPEWEEKRFEQVFKRITRKNKENNQNVLTISAQQGLINQEEYFKKSVSAKDVTGYYLLHKDDFAYNKSYSKGYPLGAIKRLKKYEKGVVSTLYICFKAIKDNKDFLEQYFEGGMLNHEIHKIAQEGARNHGLLNVSVTEFFKDIKLFLPSQKEQNKIANFLSSIDTKIQQAQNQLKQTKEFKKALLQQMFV